jgi:hypothetical protein
MNKEYITKWYSCPIPLHIIGLNYILNEVVNLAHKCITLPVFNHYLLKQRQTNLYNIYVIYVEGRAVSSFLALTSQFGTQEHPIYIFTDHMLVGWNRERE